jgi:hypothetical protein
MLFLESVAQQSRNTLNTDGASAAESKGLDEPLRAEWLARFHSVASATNPFVLSVGRAASGVEGSARTELLSSLPT